MKKVIAALLAVIMLAGCSSGVSQAEYDAVVKERDELRVQLEKSNSGTIPDQNDSSWKPGDLETNSNASDKNGSFDIEDIVSQLETTEYTWKSSNYYYVAITVRNNSSYDMDLNAAIKFLDTSGKPVGARDETKSAIAPGAETVFIFGNEVAFSSYEYELTPSQNKYYQCVSQNISYEENIVDNKVIVTAKNEGDIAVRFAQCTVLFMNGDNVVGSSYTYCIDDDNELKAGKSKAIQLNAYEPFDAVKVFFEGKANK